LRYLTVDGMPSGTGIRDTVEGGYLELHELGLSDVLLERFQAWSSEYEREAHKERKDIGEIKKLDEQGMELDVCLASAFPEYKIEYFSEGLTEKIFLKT